MLQNMTLEEAETLALSTLKQVMEEKVMTRIVVWCNWLPVVVPSSADEAGALL